MKTLNGKTQIELCRRLGKEWRDLAQYFAIPAAVCERFEPGNECYETLEGIKNRAALDELPHALTFLGRKDLLPLLLDPDDCQVPTTPQSAWQDRSPYPGLHYFTEQDEAIFFGRDKEIAALLERLNPLTSPDHRFIAVIGASGSGKSSLVGAGLIPHLRKMSWGEPWVPMRFTPGELGSDPFAPLLGQLKPLLEKNRLSTREIGDRLRARGNLAALAQDLLKNESSDAALLLFIDQFEELFTIAAPDLQPRFIVTLADAVQSSRIRVVVTLRADFLPQCLQHDELKDLLSTGTYPLAAPGPRAQMEMITGPAGIAGLELEGDLPWRILDGTGREPGALALMAYALSLLWERRRDGKLTRAAYDSFGGVQGAIREQAEQAFARLDQAAKDALGTVFRELIEVEPERGVPTRKRAPHDRFRQSPGALALIRAFTDARLLVCQQDVVEVAHEALLTHWPRLRNWTEQRFDDFRLLRQVRLEASEWRHHRPGYVPWPHERLVLVENMRRNLEPPLSPVERAFIRPESDRLLKRIRNPATNHKDRAKIGDRLAEIGDPRPGVGLRPDGLPDIDWCEVPGGKVTLEEKAGTFKVKRFHLARYLVTYAQYRSFLEAEDGYRDARWWQGLAKRENEPGQQYRDLDNHPAENVSWYDAVAFCRWLNERLVDEIRERFGENCVIRLPTEWEWQQAATGGHRENVFPWGPDWDSSRANTGESGLSRTIAVGMYPDGASPVGALDMAGNVWEWCLNAYEKPKKTDLSGSADRVVRGGSWFYVQDYARAAYRCYVDDPDDRDRYQGFRVVCSSPIF